MPDIKPTFFAKPADFRKWFQKNHEKETELYVGYYKKDTGKPSITWPESVDQALCFGWIDGVRKSLGDESYMIRFTPRKKTSIWSSVNIKRIGELMEQGLVHEKGKEAFERRTDAKSNIYSFEQKEEIKLDKTAEALFKKNKKAWSFFTEGTPPSYRKAAIWWVVSAKQEATRQKRLEQLITDSAAGQRLKHLVSPGKK